MRNSLAKSKQDSVRWVFWAAFGGAALVLGLRLGVPGLLEPDEARYAAVGQAMATTGDLITPRFNGFVYLDKPPLLHWTTALALTLLGPREFAVRLPSMLAAALGVALTYLFGCHVYGHKVGIAAATVLLSSVMWFAVGRVIRYDMLLTLAVTASIWWAWLGSERGRHGHRYYLFAAVAMGLGVLVKGPVAVALPLLVFFLYLTLTRRLSTLKEIPWLYCIGLFALLAGPWFVLCERANPGALRFFLLHENIARATGNINPTHWRPSWYFLGVLFGGISPWILFLPGAVVEGCRGIRGGEGVPRRACVLWVVWLVGVVALFSIPKVKLITYILPAMPAAALLLGQYICSVHQGGRWCALLTGLLLTAGAYGLMTVGAHAIARKGIPTEPLVPLLGGLWLLGGIGALAFALSRWNKIAFAALALCAVGTYHLVIWGIDMAPASPSDKSLAQVVARLRQPGEEIFCVRKLSRGTIFYLNTRLRTLGEMPAEYDFPPNASQLEGWVYPITEAADVLAKRPRCLILCRQQFLGEFTAAVGDRAKVIAKAGKYVILRSVPAGKPARPAGDASQ
ncbi:MAG: ArnT family glycosyltransferase [Candidatus Zipacnadales bacterium]